MSVPISSTLDNVHRSSGACSLSLRVRSVVEEPWGHRGEAVQCLPMFFRKTTRNSNGVIAHVDGSTTRPQLSCLEALAFSLASLSSVLSLLRQHPGIFLPTVISATVFLQTAEYRRTREMGLRRSQMVDNFIHIVHISYTNSIHTPDRLQISLARPLKEVRCDDHNNNSNGRAEEHEHREIP